MAEVQNTLQTENQVETKLNLVEVAKGTTLRRADGVEFIYYGPDERTGLIILVDLAKETEETKAKQDWHATYAQCHISLIAEEVQKMQVVTGTTLLDYLSDLRALRSNARDVAFRVGDKVNQAGRYGLLLPELAHQTGFEESTLKQYALYAKAFPAHTGARDIEVGISYYSVLLKDDIPFADKLVLLNRAALRNMKRKDFERDVAGHKAMLEREKQAEKDRLNPPVETGPPTPEAPTPEAQGPGRPKDSAQDPSKVTQEEPPVKTANDGLPPAPDGIPHNDPSLKPATKPSELLLPSDVTSKLRAALKSDEEAIRWIEEQVSILLLEQDKQRRLLRKVSAERAQKDPTGTTEDRAKNLEFRTDPNTVNGEKVPA